jgi:hypothetical protein
MNPILLRLKFVFFVTFILLLCFGLKNSFNFTKNHDFYKAQMDCTSIRAIYH